MNERIRRWLGQLGPGLITGAADDDPSGIATYSQAGAQFGFQLGWTIVLTYPHAQGIIQASWNWAIDRKDMEIYGVTGALRLPDRSAMFLRKPGEDRETQTKAPALATPQADSISHFAAIVRGQIKSEGLGSLETNLIVNEILEAAKESAKTGRRVELGK